MGWFTSLVNTRGNKPVIQGLLLLATLAFGLVGVRAILDDMLLGVPPRSGIDSLMMAGLFAAILGVWLWLGRRKPPRAPK